MAIVNEVYATATFLPKEEMYGMRSQMTRIGKVEALLALIPIGIGKEQKMLTTFINRLCLAA